MRGSLPSAGGPTSQARAATGIEGLDDVLGGGLTPHRLYLIEGVPGSGKTTLALQFLLEGARRGEPVLYITLSETEEELRQVAASHGWSLDGITIRELVPSEESLRPDEQYTMFHPSEVELSETTKTILADVERVKPTRVVFDSLSELRLLAGEPAALSPADSRPQAVLQRPQVHRAAAGRHDQHAARPPGAEHRARRRAAGAAVSGIRRGAAAAASCSSIRGVALPRRLSRLHHQAGRHRGLSAARRRRTPPRAQPARSFAAASPRWTRCSAAASSGGPAR